MSAEARADELGLTGYMRLLYLIESLAARVEDAINRPHGVAE